MPSSGFFHSPNGPVVGSLPKFSFDKAKSVIAIQPFLGEGEMFIWDGPYNTKEPVIATRSGQSMGRLFVTNVRLLFWSDDVPKPHAGLFYEDIEAWRTSWMPLKSRGVFVTTGGQEFLFAANVTAVQKAETYIKRKS